MPELLVVWTDRWTSVKQTGATLNARWGIKSPGKQKMQYTSNSLESFT